MVFLSIVIPTYNRAHLIESTLKSVLNQNCNDFEVLIIDDGSTDNTESVVQPFLSDNCRYFKIQNSERGAARNRGTELARGKYINWFDSDDIMLNHHVQTIKNLALENNDPRVISVMYAIKEFDTEKLTLINNRPSPNTRKQKDPLIEGNYLACNPVIVRRDIALGNPFYEDRKLSASEDYELWLRLKAKYTFVSSDEITSFLIQHPERSVNQMTDPTKLENRFLTFIQLTTSNNQVVAYLGKDLNYFVMRNYLILAVDLAFNGHKKLAIKYLRKALFSSISALRQKVFWATIKHLII